MIPRPIADLIALARSMVTSPREVLLLRGHHQWVGAGVIGLALSTEWIGRPVPASVLAPVLIAAGMSWGLDLLGTLAHGLWKSGRLWPGIDCPCCGEHPDDGDDEPELDDPADGGGLARDIEAWLRSQPTPTR
jgi:hypothetical protein